MVLLNIGLLHAMQLCIKQDKQTNEYILCLHLAAVSLKPTHEPFSPFHSRPHNYTSFKSSTPELKMTTGVDKVMSHTWTVTPSPTQPTTLF